MDTHASPHRSVHKFAEIMAALADPFVKRVTVLSATGHDASSWAGIEREWTERIQQDATGELGAAYGAAFSRASARQQREDINQAPTESARFLNSAAQSWRHEAAGVLLDAHGEAPPSSRLTAGRPISPTSRSSKSSSPSTPSAPRRKRKASSAGFARTSRTPLARSPRPRRRSPRARKTKGPNRLRLRP